MKVLVTGAKGFIGHHVADALRHRGDEVFAADRHTEESRLREWALASDAIVHLAGANRPEDPADFERINRDLTERLVGWLQEGGSKATLVLSSSTQARSENPYGVSKREAEAAVESYAGPKAIFRLPGVFGKESRPFYNTVVATFCHNVAHDEPCAVSDPSREVEFVYIDDVVASFLAAVDQPVARPEVTPVYRRTLGRLLAEIEGFRESRETLRIPDLSDRFLVLLYATYLSFLPKDDFAYDLMKREDPRGSRAEFVKSDSFGQIFVSRTHPGVTRGDHYHHTKTERFLVLEGEAMIRFRHRASDEVVEYPVSGKGYRVVDIPPGYTHSIENVGMGELVTLFWASEIFDPERPDTIYEKVIR